MCEKVLLGLPHSMKAQSASKHSVAPMKATTVLPQAWSKMRSRTARCWPWMLMRTLPVRTALPGLAARKTMGLSAVPLPLILMRKSLWMPSARSTSSPGLAASMAFWASSGVETDTVVAWAARARVAVRIRARMADHGCCVACFIGDSFRGGHGFGVWYRVCRVPVPWVSKASWAIDFGISRWLCRNNRLAVTRRRGGGTRRWRLGRGCCGHRFRRRGLRRAACRWRGRGRNSSRRRWVCCSGGRT